MNKPSFCIIDNSISFTGAFKCALAEANILKDKFRFIFIVPEGSSVKSNLEEYHIQYYTLPMLEIGKSAKKLLLYSPRLFTNTLRLQKIIKKENVEILQVNDYYNLLGVSSKWLHFNGKLITYVRFLPSAVPSILNKLWINLAKRYSDKIIAVSDAVLHQLPSHSKCARIYDAIQLSEILPEKLDGGYNGRVTFLYLSNYIRGKGQQYALHALSEVVSQNRNVFLKFVGSDMGLLKNKEFKQELHQLVVKNELQDHVVFDSFQSDIEKTIKEADIVLNFSEAESFSMTCAEASFYGVPVISTRCGGPEEIIEHQKTGMLVEKGNITEMRDAMLFLAQNPNARYRFGCNARLLIRKRFSAENYKQDFIKVVEGNGDED